MNYHVTSKISKRLINPLSIFRTRNSPEKTRALNMSNNFTFLPRSPRGSTWLSKNKAFSSPVWSDFKPIDPTSVTDNTLYSALPGRTFRSLRIESRIPTKSVHGEAYKCKYNNRPVILKVIKLTDQSELNGFVNEMQIGTIKGIEKVGTRTLAYGISQRIAYHVMTDVTYNESNLTSVSLNEYMKRLNSCPSKEHLLYKKLFKTLFDFYKLTKGYHGDLHGGNVYVVYKPTDINQVVSIKIIDYGAHTKFKNSVALEKCKTIAEIFNMIDTNYMKNYITARHLNITRPLTHLRAAGDIVKNIRVIYPNNREAYRQNSELLAKGVAFAHQPTSNQKYSMLKSVIGKLTPRSSSKP